MEQQRQPDSLDECLFRAVRNACCYDPKSPSLFYGLCDIERLLCAGANPRSKNSQGETALEYVLAPQEKCESPPYGIVHARIIGLWLLSAIDANTIADVDEFNAQQYLEKFMFDQVNEVDEIGCTSLHYAAYVGNAEIIAFLLFKGALPDFIGHDGKTPLLVAMDADHIDNDKRLKVAKLLIEAGADINAATSGQQMTSLHYACRRKDEETVEFLLSHGALTDPVNEDGDNALFIAVKWGNDRIVQRLIDAGANINESLMMNHSMYGGRIFWTTALCVAVEAQKMDTVRCLLEHGADPNRPNTSDGGDCNSALYYLLVYHDVNADRFSILKLLLSHGADMYRDLWHNNYRDTPFERIVKYGSVDEMRLFLENGLDLSRLNPTSNETGFSALHEIVRRRDKDRLSLLLQYNTRRSLDLDSFDRNYRTPLTWAVLNRSPDCVRILLESGAAVDHCHTHARTPLELGVSDERPFEPECIKLLVEAGAKLGNVLVSLITKRNSDEIWMDKLRCIIKHRVLFEIGNSSSVDTIEHELPREPILIRSYYEACKAEMTWITNFFTENGVKFCDMLHADKHFHRRMRNEVVYGIFEDKNFQDRCPIYAKDLRLRFENLVNVHRV